MTGTPDCDPPRMHSFANPFVPCQCGAERWPDLVEIEEKATAEVRAVTGDQSLTVVFETADLLSPEKPEEKKWPDDFRGFNTNVRPKRQ